MIVFTIISTIVSLLSFDQKINDKVIYNEEKEVFETSMIETKDIDTWSKLQVYIEKDMLRDEKEFNRNIVSVQKGFLDDLTYLKQKGALSLAKFQMLNQWAKNKQNPQHKILNPKNIQLTPLTLTNEMKQQLILEANRARTYAYCPYSKFHVGSALLTKDGNIYSGCNFENAAYGNTICAERSAIAKAISEENRGISFQQNNDIVAIAVVIRGGGGSPCGNCRQALNEFNPDMLVIMSDVDCEDIIEKSLSELLPMGFGPSNLEKAEVK